MLDEDFFKSLRANEHVDFVLPLTRSLSVTVDLKAPQKIMQNLDALPTAYGDPLAKASGIFDSLERKELFMSEVLAQDLKLEAGQSVKLIVSRIINNKRQNAVVEFTLKGLIKKEYLSYKTILLYTDTLIAMEDYRDGFDPEIFSDGSRPYTVRSYLLRRVFL